MPFPLVDWPRFIAATILLLTPIGLFHGRRVRYRAISRDWDHHWPQVLQLGLHTIDFLRAALGTWLLLASLTVAPKAHGLAAFAPLLVSTAIRVLAVWLQAIVCREPEAIQAPFLFVAASLLAGTAPLPATIALALAIPIALGARAPIAFFPLLSVFFFAADFLFAGRGAIIKHVAEICLPLVPWLWALLFNRDLVVGYRSRRGEDDAALSPLR